LRQLISTISVLLLLFVTHNSVGQKQHQLLIDATLNTETHTLQIKQTLVYENTSNDVLNEIYLLDWANSFSTKTSPLGKRFAENFSSSFHFEKDEERGRTKLYSITKENLNPLTWEREEVDIVKVTLENPIAPGESTTLKLLYEIVLPKTKFTRYGYDDKGNFNLRYWYISPAVYDGKWRIYSNKNLDDHFILPSHFNITLHIPKNYTVVNDLFVVSENNKGNEKIIKLVGEQRNEVKLYITNSNDFESVLTDKLELITNLDDKHITAPIKALNIDRILLFLENNLGEYPFEKMVISKQDYKQSPVYGLNQLPDFIRPFPDGFQYDIEQLKTITANYIKNTLILDPREEHWLCGAIQIYLMMKYTDMYYPDMKILGSVSNWWIIKWSHASEMEFNDQYNFLYMNMVRNNLDQALTTPKDLLVKFNKNIASSYKGGSGLNYLKDYLGGQVIDETIKEFYITNRLKKTTAATFNEILKTKTELPIDWFFEDYVDSNIKIDFKIKKVTKLGDSLQVTILNKQDNNLPVSLYGLNKKQIVSKTWVPKVDGTATVTIASKDIRKLALNYEQVIPEFNMRNNFKNLKGILNRPIQVRLFKDIEDPKYNQLFVMPVFAYNLYDGFTLGPKLYNKTILPKQWNYKIEPQYGFTSNKILGNAFVSYTHNSENKTLYKTRFGISGSTFSYNVGLTYKRYAPFITFSFRDKDDLRSNLRQFINIRNINVEREQNDLVVNNTPDYSVFDISYVYANNNLIDYYKTSIDFQISKKFSKVSTTLEYRKLFLSNRQLNIRFFGGLFVYNNTDLDDDFFSFALDRPTDYLFDYNYYGRSEASGFFSQQIIIAEGGFKSRVNPAFANSWLATVNASTNIWKWVYAYGDAGIIHNRGFGTKTVFDTGIRLSLVADYFELYFPLYSSLGWEPGLPNYNESVRFIITLSPRTLFGLFTREWY